MPESVSRTRTSPGPGSGSAISPTSSTSAAGPARSYHAANIAPRYPSRTKAGPGAPASHAKGTLAAGKTTFVGRIWAAFAPTDGDRPRSGVPLAIESQGPSPDSKSPADGCRNDGVGGS